jgi:TatD DNase family protein
LVNHNNFDVSQYRYKTKLDTFLDPCQTNNKQIEIKLKMLHDTHAHLEMLLTKLGFLNESLEKSENIEEQKLSNEAKFKLSQLLTNHEFVLQSTVSTSNFQYVTQLFQGFEKIKYFLGSHPEIVNVDFDIKNYLITQKLFLEKHSEIIKGKFKNQTVAGIGEVGLDYHYTQDAKLIKTQKELFEAQIQLAIEYNLPLMIHCRDAFDDLFEILYKYPKIHNKFLIHCFTGGIDEMYKTIKIGGKVAFGGVITFKSAKNVQEAAEYCPLENFVLETDLPFLSPKRGEICIPEHIDLVATKVAELKKIPKQEVWELSKRNCKDLFEKL